MTEILVGLDAKPGAQDALAFARRLAGTTGATLRVDSLLGVFDEAGAS